MLKTFWTNCSDVQINLNDLRSLRKNCSRGHLLRTDGHCLANSDLVFLGVHHRFKIKIKTKNEKLRNNTYNPL